MISHLQMITVFISNMQQAVEFYMVRAMAIKKLVLLIPMGTSFCYIRNVVRQAKIGDIS